MGDTPRVFMLLGFVPTFPSYPCLVQPVGEFRGQRVIRVTEEEGYLIKQFERACPYVRVHPPSRPKIRRFNWESDALLALSDSDLRKYAPAEANQFFLGLLEERAYEMLDLVGKLTLARLFESPWTAALLCCEQFELTAEYFKPDPECFAKEFTAILTAAGLTFEDVPSLRVKLQGYAKRYAEAS